MSQFGFGFIHNWNKNCNLFLSLIFDSTKVQFWFENEAQFWSNYYWFGLELIVNYQWLIPHSPFMFLVIFYFKTCMLILISFPHKKTKKLILDPFFKNMVIVSISIWKSGLVFINWYSKLQLLVLICQNGYPLYIGRGLVQPLRAKYSYDENQNLTILKSMFHSKRVLNA